MSVDSVLTVKGSRPELLSLAVNAPIGYIGNQILPMAKIAGKAGTVYAATLVADSVKQTSRTAGAAPTATTLAENAVSVSTKEYIKRYQMPWEAVPLFGGVEASDVYAAKAAKRSVENAIETLQLATLVDGAGTSITSAIVDGIIDGCDQVHRYYGKFAFVTSVGQYRWLMQQTEIKNLLVRFFSGGMEAMDALSLSKTAFKNMLQSLFGIEEVLIADDKFWPYAYRTTSAVVKIPYAADMSFISEPQYGRLFCYWPSDAGEYEINSFPYEANRANVFDATAWLDPQQFNSGAKALLTLNTSGSTT